MGLESTILCVDNSEYMRNGDFVPSRLQAEQDAVSLICQCKLRMHPENNVGLLTMASQVSVLSTLTQDTSKIFMKMHQVKPSGLCNFLSGIKVAHLALKHRQGRNHKMRIVVFVGSPIDVDSAELVKLAKRLRKEKVNVDIVNFGEEVSDNTEKLHEFIETLNGKDGANSHLVTVPAGSSLSEALLLSPVLRGDDGEAPAVAVVGGGADFGVDPNEDPELALALRVSMEEQRARQEAETRRTQDQAQDGSAESAAAPVPSAEPVAAASSDANLEAMTEDEQIAWALRMSLQQDEEAQKMEIGENEGSAATSTGGGGPSASLATPGKNDFADLLTDPNALEDLVRTLPGVDPNSKEVQDSLQNLTKAPKKADPKKDKPSDKDGSKK